MSYPDDILIPPLTIPVEWEKAGKVHDWRNHVGHNTRRIWDSLSTDQQVAIALDAQQLASREEWE